MPSRAYRRGRELSLVSSSLIVAAFLLFSTSLAIGVADQLHQRSIAAIVQAPKPRYLVVLVLDGARPEYLHLTPLPHLDTLRQQGVEYDQAWDDILESETPAGHATLATGSSPARDGLLGFNWVNGDNDSVHLFDPNVVRQGAIEHVMQQAGAPTIAALFKARYPKARVVAISGHKYYAADPLGGPAADYIMYYGPGPNQTYIPTAIPGHVPPATVLNGPGLISKSMVMGLGQEDTLAVKLALHSFQVLHQQVTLINLPEFDWPLGHVDGPDRGKAITLMQGFDRDLGTIEDAYRKAGVLDQTLFVVTADHGMAPLKYQIPDSVLDNAVTKAGATSLETTYSTAGYIWLKDNIQAPAVAANVVAARDPHLQSVYYLVTDKTGPHYVRASGLDIPAGLDNANHYLLRSFLGGNAPDVVAFCTEDAAFVKQGAENWKGNHGGGSWESQHIPLIFAGAGVSGGFVSHASARLEDVAPTALTIMGVKPAGMQGSPLADAMRAPTAQQLATQSALNRTLAPVTAALQTESQRELAAGK